jgi:protein-tyrosine phosphatase
MIDWHSHILPGIDDGPPEMEQSVAVAAALSTAGFTTVYCTPHLIRGLYEAGNDQVLEGVDALQAQLVSRGIPLSLRAGREYCLDEYLNTSLEDPLTLGDSRLILVEIPPRMTGDIVRRVLYDVVRSGFTPVIAHPERCHLLEPPVSAAGRTLLGNIKGLLGLSTPVRYEQAADGMTGNPLFDFLHDLGCSFQGNLGSFNGYYGWRVRAVAEKLRELGIYDRYGSDLHAPEQAGMILGAARTD